METKQTIHLDENNKLVVETNNATIDGYNKTSTGLNGEFIIQANDVAKLLSMINEANIRIDTYSYNFFETIEYHIVSDNDFSKELRKLESQCSLYSSRLEVEKEISAHLHNKITEFNETRHWWERKIKIDEE